MSDLVGEVLRHGAVEPDQGAVLVHVGVGGPVVTANPPVPVIGVLRPDRLLVSAVVADDELAVRVELPGARVDRVELTPREVGLNRLGGVDVEAAVVGGALAPGGVGHGAVVGVDRAVDVAHLPHKEDVSGLDARGVGGLETQRGLLIARLALVVGGAGTVNRFAPVTDRRVLAAAAVNRVSPVVVGARRVASASTRVCPLPRVGVVAVPVRRCVVHTINRVKGTHIGDLHRGVPQGNGEVTGGGIRGRRRPRERHHGHQDDRKRTDHRTESVQ